MEAKGGPKSEMAEALKAWWGLYILHISPSERVPKTLQKRRLPGDPLFGRLFATFAPKLSLRRYWIAPVFVPFWLPVHPPVA